MTADKVKSLIGEWPQLAQERCAERWSIKREHDDSDRHFWQAVKETREAWAKVWGKPATETQLRIKDEAKEQQQWNKSQAALHSLQQQRLY